jgi:hypothetical protein
MKFVEPEVPKIARPAAPASVAQQSSIGEFVAGQYVGLDVQKFAYLQSLIVIGHDRAYYPAEIHYSPWDQLGCPCGKHCGTYNSDQANIWLTATLVRDE